MPAPPVLRLAEAQQLLDVLEDQFVHGALQEFFFEQRKEHVSLLLRAVLQKDRDTMKEAALAGKIDAYETTLLELRHFAERQMREASQ